MKHNQTIKQAIDALLGATNLIRETVPVSSLKNGDTVEIGGELQTVSPSDLSNGFMGHTFRGDPFRGGGVRGTFKVKTLNGYRYQ